MSWTFKPGWGYDYYDHWDVVKWILEHGRLPAVDALRESFHPPLFYVTAALLTKLGVSVTQMVALPIVCGIVRLGLIWLGLELYLESRLARVSALSLAAVTAASVHIDGMVYTEAMNGLLTTTTMLLAAQTFGSEGRRRWKLALVTGLVLGITLLTKISALVLLGAIGATALLELLFSRKDLEQRLSQALPWTLVLALVVGVAGWFFARNLHDYHSLFVTSFDLPSERILVSESNKLPVLGRRSLDFVFGWDRSVFFFPYFPSGIYPRPQFFPVAVASTFVDYWNYAFSAVPPGTDTVLHVATGPLLPQILRVSQWASIGGALIFAATGLAWFGALPGLLRRREYDRLAFVLVPFFTLLAAMHFAIAYPVDRSGVVKGVYMQFGAPPLYALFGIAVSWVRKRADLWPLQFLLFLAFWGVAAYTIYCRLRIPLVPIN